MTTHQDIFVSVVMPVFNSEKYLAESIESILNQTYTNFEFIIINDASTDNSEKIIQSYDDDRIKYLVNGKNQGNAYCRNLGLHEAKGKYLIIQDSDDISVPERIAKQVEFMENNHEIGAAGSFIRVLEQDNEYVKYYPIYYNVNNTTWNPCWNSNRNLL